ncbi:hypothetical protein GCM10029964_041670 [Kibdelosporangium lantanae]
MVAFRDLLDVSAGQIDEAAERWEHARQDLLARCADLDAKVKALDGWEGAAADSARSTFANHRKQLVDSAEAFGHIAPLLRAAGPQLGAAHQRLVTAVADARSAGLEVVPETGQVVLSPAPATPRGVDLSQRDAIQARIDSALLDATRVDNETAAALRNFTAAAVGLAPSSSGTALASAFPPPGTSPMEVKKWWDSLTPAEQESLLFTRAAQVGGLDGVPAVVRDRANRSLLAGLEGRSRADELRLLGRGDLSEAEQKQLADVRAKQNGLRAIESRLTREPPAFVLGVDVNGNGRAIIASGNPDTAVNVATFVPGTGANLGGVGGLIDRSDRMLGAAANAGSPSTAVITWVGYDAPQDLLQAGDAKYADKARGDLDRFQDGLRATHEGAPSHNTVVGHSYGTTVIGHTAHENVLNVDDVVFVGSPGVGVRHASDLNLPPDTSTPRWPNTTRSLSPTRPRPSSTHMVRVPRPPVSVRTSSPRTRGQGAHGGRGT